MRTLSSIGFHSTISCLASFTLLVATLTRSYAASASNPPSPEDQWLYPDVNTVPTYNYVDILNASWTSNFVQPYLLLRCEHPNDAVHYAYPYNKSVSATGSALVPLDDGNEWVCHFEVSDLSKSGAAPPTFRSNDFNIVLKDGTKPVFWTNLQDGRENGITSLASNIPTTSPTTSTTSISSITTSSISTTNLALSSAVSTLATAPTSPSAIASSSAVTSTPAQSPTSATPLSTSTGLSKSKKIAIILGSTMGALLLLVVATAVHFILPTRRSDQNAVVYRSEPGDGYGGKEIPGVEAPRERWK